jgi:Transferase family
VLSEILDLECLLEQFNQVQVTELTDGMFVGCVFNHAIGDGTSFWMFFNAWAEIARCKAAGKEVVLSQPPVHDKWFIGGYGDPPIKLSYSSPDEFVVRFTPPPLRERMFHFSIESLAKLKARANQECGKGTYILFGGNSCMFFVEINVYSSYEELQGKIHIYILTIFVDLGLYVSFRYNIYISSFECTDVALHYTCSTLPT